MLGHNSHTYCQATQANDPISFPAACMEGCRIYLHHCTIDHRFQPGQREPESKMMLAQFAARALLPYSEPYRNTYSPRKRV